MDLFDKYDSSMIGFQKYFTNWHNPLERVSH